MYVKFTSDAVKQYLKLPQREQQKIKKWLALLGNDPLAGKCLKGELIGYRSIKAWPYRVIYFIKQTEKTVWVTSIEHRQSAYRR